MKEPKSWHQVSLQHFYSCLVLSRHLERLRKPQFGNRKLKPSVFDFQQRAKHPIFFESLEVSSGINQAWLPR